MSVVDARVRSRLSTAVQAAFAVLAVGIVWLATILWPVPPSPGLDPSWQQVLVDAWLRERRFGHDIVFTYGPLGFLLVPHVLPDALTVKLAFELGGRLTIAGVLVALAWPLPVLRRVIWIAAIAVFGVGMFDAVVLVAIAGVLSAWILPPGRPIRSGVGIAFITIGALVKLTLMSLAFAGITLIAVAAVADRRPGRAVAITAGTAVSLAAFWLLAGQWLRDLWSYLRLGLEVAWGYPLAMGLDETTPTFLAGITVLLAHACWLLPALWIERSDYKRLPIVALCALAVFLAWKQGFTRADNHTQLFFISSILLATLLPVMGGTAAWAEFGGLVAMATGLVAMEVAFPGIIPAQSVSAVARLESARRQMDVASVVDAFSRQAADVPPNWRLPRTRALVGGSTIDLLGHDQGMLYLNGLNYQPRPVPQGYVAYTPALADANRRFLLSERAPQFMLAALHTIDGRYPSQDDAALLLELPRRYDPQFVERGYVLLSRREVQPPPLSPPSDALLDVTVQPGQTVELPPRESNAHVLTIEAQPSVLARLRALVYRPPLLHMTLTDDRGSMVVARVVPAIAAAGFVIQPRLLDHADFVAWLNGEEQHWNRRLVLGTGAGEPDAWIRFRVKVLRVPELRLRSEPLRSLVTRGITSVAPIRVTSLHPWEVREPFPRLLLHAPGELDLPVPAGARRLTGSFGLEPGAYGDAGHTDGAEFIVESLDASGASSVIWQRVLRPKTVPEDRGEHRLGLDLPSPRPAVLRLRTDPGPDGSTNWDWTYLTGLAFEQE